MQHDYGSQSLGILAVAAVWGTLAGGLCGVGVVLLLIGHARAQTGSAGYALLGVGALVLAVAVVRYIQALLEGRRFRRRT
jgi:hypothetical protein